MKSKFGFMQTIVSLLAITLLAVCALIVISKQNDGEVEKFSLTQGTNTAGPIESGVTVEQTFVANENYLCRLDIFLSNYGEPNDSDTTIELFDDKNNCIYSETVPVYEINANSYRTIMFDMIPNSKGKLFKLTIKCEAAGWTHSMAAWCTEDDAYTDGTLLVNGEEAGYDIVFKAYSAIAGLSKELSAAVLLCVLISAAVILLYHILLKKFNESFIKLTCWALCSLYISLSITAVYLKLSGAFIEYGLFDKKAIFKALIILPFIMLVSGCSFFNIGNKIKVKEWISHMWKSVYPVLIIGFVFSFMLLIYEPIMIYSANKNDFKFDIAMMMPSLLLSCLICLVIIASFFVTAYIINGMFSKNHNVFYCISIGFFIVFFATYIQGNWLAGDLPVLTGETIKWDSFLKNDIITIIVWLVLIVATICCSVKFTPKKMSKVYGFLSAAVFLMLGSALLSKASFTGDNKGKKIDFIATKKNLNKISTDKNFLIFLVDAVDSMTFNNIVESNPDYKEVFKGFTYYNNTVSCYPFTATSVPHILTGKIYKNEAEYRNNYYDFTNKAFNNSELFALLSENNYDINLYDEEDIRWNSEKNYKIENMAESFSTNMLDFLKEEIKYVSFKYLPYALKIYSHIETADFNEIFECDEPLFDADNLACYNEIKSNPQLKIQDKPMFQFVHIDGGHSPFTYDKDLNKGDFTYEQAIEGSITVVNEYLQRLKNNNAYDNSVIIVMADHGYRPGNDGWDSKSDSPGFARYNPFLLIKGINENHEYTISDKPISYALDLQHAYKDLVYGKQNAEIFSDVTNDRKRVVLWYRLLDWTSFVEYEVKGKAWEIDKYEPTGNVY